MNNFTSTAARIFLLFAIAASGACLTAQPPTCPEREEHFTRYELFMGRSAGAGEIVDDAAWDTFLEDTVTPRFPDGLTVLDGRGQWRDSTGTIQRERSKLLIILAPPGEEGLRLIEEVSEEYKRSFSQESILRVVSPACAAF